MRKLKLFFACLLMAVLSIGQVWATDVTYKLTIDANDFNTTSYAANNNAKTTDAVCTTDNTKTYEVTWTSNQVMKNGTNMQWQKSKGYIYNSTDLGTITNVTVTSSAGSFTTYYGTSEQPSSGSAGAGKGYFKTSVGGATGTTSKVEITFTINESETPQPSLSVAPTVIDFGTVEQGTTGLEEAVAVTFANLTGSVSYTGLSGAFSATGNISSTGDEITIAANTSTVGEYEQTLTVTSAADNKSATVTVTMNVVTPFNGLQLTFPDQGTEGGNVSSYTTAWSAIKGTQTWSIYGFNSNKWQSSWSYIKAGRKSGTGSVAQPVTATIATQVTGHAIGDIVVTVDAVTAAQVTSHKLYVADNADYNNAIEVVGNPAAIATGNITYTVPTANRANDLYYKLEYETAGTASSNGSLTISKITYAYAAATPQKPSAGLAFDAAQKLAKLGAAFTAPTFSTAEGFDGTVTYASSDEAVVKVNASTGAITEIVAAGKAVITAHSDETENFKEGSASYTIFVAEQAGTSQDPLTEASAKALIDLGCTLSAYVKGTVASAHTMTSAGQVTVVLAGGMQFFHMLNVGGVAFTTETLPEFTAGDEVTAVGGLFKYNNSTYELEENCQMVVRIPYETPKQSIANTKETAYSVETALGYAADPVTYDITESVYIAGVVYDVKSFNSNNGTYDIYIKDAGAENKFEFRTCTGLYDADLDAVVPFDEGDVQIGDEVIGYGVMYYYNQGSIWQFNQGGNYLVSLNRPTIAVTGIDLTESTTEVEVGSTVTLHASVVPGNATDQGIVWSVTSGSDKASVDENGVVTGTAAGEAVIRAASHEDASIYEECTVTVTAVDPTVHHVTFIAGTDQSDETSITKDGITISATTFNNDNYYQCYSGEAMTVSSTVGNITKIEFTCTTEGTAKYGPGNWDFTGYSYSGANGSWTGSAETVEFGNASQQVRMTLITVTYKEDNREAAGLAWNPADDIEITVGDAFSAPALLNPNSIAANEITISSDNTELATVTAGVVALVADATGTATITATFAGNDDYKPATISYNITVNEAGLDNVTFDSSEDHAESGETTITKGGFTLSFTSGSMDGTQAEYRLYKGQTMTLSSTDYKIKKIEFTCTSGNPISGFADATGLDKDNNEWTGESNTVELTASNAQVRMTKIKVFYVDDTRAAAGLAWNPADNIELTVGGAFSAPALYNPNNIAENLISITSSNESVATVSEGEVSLVADATGTTTITATFAGNDDYKPATVSYKITVNPAYSIYVSPSLNVNFGSVEQDAEVADKKISVTFTNVPAATLTLEGAGASAFTISPAAAMTESGDITISASSANVGTFAATLTISDDDNNAESKVVNLSITVNEPVIAETPVSTSSKWVPATEIADGMQVLITGVKADVTYAMGAASSNSNNRTSVAGSLDEGVFTPGENTMPFTLVATGAANTYYIKTSNNQYLYNASSSTKSYLKTKAEQEDVSWTIELDGDNNAVITSVENTNRQIMRFNTNGGNDPLFNCYASGQTAIKLYVPQSVTPEPPTPVYTEVRNGLEVNRYYTVCLEKKVVAVKGATFWSVTYKNSENTAAYLIEENAPFTAGQPYIIQATDDNEGKLEVAYEGTSVNAPIENGALRGTFEYMDADDLAAAGSNIYMLFNNELRPIGTNNHLDAHRAYVLYNELDPINEAPSAPGRRVKSMPMQPNTATDIDVLNASEVPVKVLINGQIFILRGEKMYDTTGRLVK